MAMANAVIDEPTGDLDLKWERDSVITNIKNLGRMKRFDQTVTLNYTLPLDKFPITDWLGADYRGQAAYRWTAGPVNIPDEIAERDNLQDIPDELDFKNTIQNNRDHNVTGKVDMVKLYNKISFLKELNTPPRPVVPARPQPGRPTPAPRPAPDTVKSPPGLVKGFFRLLMSLRSINGTYTLGQGTILPGFVGTPRFFGMDEHWKAPGWRFVLGDQDPNIRLDLANRGMITDATELTMPFSQVKAEKWNLKGNVEPASDLKITLDVKKDVTAMFQEIFRFDGNTHVSLNPSRSGTYAISTLSINTAFDRTNRDVSSNVFQKFEENLGVVRNRFGALVGVPEIDTVQDVLIPSFIAAYTGQDASRVSLSPFPSTPMPNWRIDYTGLGKLGRLKDIFQAVTISHGYASTYTVLNYSNTLALGNNEGLAINRPVEDYNRRYFGGLDEDGNFLPVYVISQVLISEQMKPLIGLSFRTKSRLQVRTDYNTKRELALNIPNAQVTELTSRDVTIDIGYTKANMRLPFKVEGRTIVLKNDVTFKMMLTISETKTIQRKISAPNTITNGNVNFQLRPNVSYNVNQKLTLQAYFERTINEPFVTNSYPRSTTRFGVQLRFSLAP